MTAAPLTAEAVEECCGSRRWRELVCAGLPFGSHAELLAAVDQAFDALTREDWLEAFAAHSTIGAVAPGDWTGAREQYGMEAADAELRIALAASNLEYRARFGFGFLIRAWGRSGEELLQQLRTRLQNSAEIEFAIACAQQREITALRLAGLLAGAVAPQARSA